MHYMKLNSSKHRLNTKNQSLLSFFVLQYAKLRILELYYNFSTKFCNVNKFEELELDNDSLYLVLADAELKDCIRPERKAEWKQLPSNDCTVCSITDAVGNFFLRMCCEKHKKHDKREPGLFKEEFRFLERLCFCIKT